MSISKKIVELGLNAEVLRKGIEALEAEGSIEIDAGRVSLAETAKAERGIAENLRRMATADVEELDVPGDLWGNLAPDIRQIEAVEMAARHNVLVLTGGPGVGKTATAKAILALFEHNTLSFVQVAPTGKAAKRMTESTGRDARTIHRALGRGKNGGFAHHAGNPFPVGAVLADETSMLDVVLADALLSACRTGTRLLIIGDVDQLPSIGPGRVLHDLIESGVIPVARLEKIFRQASESRIPYVARDLNRGALPSPVDVADSDVRFFERELEAHALDLVVKGMLHAIPDSRGIPTDQIQVLAPQRSGTLGVENLNKVLQMAINPGSDAESLVAIGGGYTAQRGDRIMQTKNNYDLGVFNGEMGVVVLSDPRGMTSRDIGEARTSADANAEPQVELFEDEYTEDEPEDREETDEQRAAREAKEKARYVLVCRFDDRTIAYTKEEAYELHLGYAITIHKSQGSQFPAIIMVVHHTHQWMLSRQLVYTGLTRAANLAVLVGEERALGRAVQNTRAVQRRTRLGEYLTRQA